MRAWFIANKDKMNGFRNAMKTWRSDIKKKMIAGGNGEKTEEEKKAEAEAAAKKAAAEAAAKKAAKEAAKKSAEEHRTRHMKPADFDQDVTMF